MDKIRLLDVFIILCAVLICVTAYISPDTYIGSLENVAHTVVIACMFVVLTICARKHKG